MLTPEICRQRRNTGGGTTDTGWAEPALYEQALFAFLISKNRLEQTLTICLQNGEYPFFSLIVLA